MINICFTIIYTTEIRKSMQHHVVWDAKSVSKHKPPEFVGTSDAMGRETKLKNFKRLKNI